MLLLQNKKENIDGYQDGKPLQGREQVAEEWR